MSRPYLHTIKSVDFKIDGFGFLDVSSFSMDLQLGTVPMATIGVALAGGDKKSSKQGATSINPFSLGTINSRVNMLIALAAKSTTCHFRARLETTRLTDGAEGEQSIELRNWILVSAGVGNVTSTTGFSCTCTIAHPIYLLCMHGGFLSNANEPLNKAELAEGVENVVDAGIKIYTALSEVEEKLEFIDSGATVVPGSKSATDIMSDVDEVFKEVPKLIERYMEWRPELGGGSNGVPFQGILTDELSMATRVDMLETWMPMGTNSVWDIFIGCVCSEFDVTIVPDYTKEKLPVTPFYPWMSPSMELNEDDLFELSFPGMDPAPIYGLCASPQMEQLNTVCSTFDGTKSEGLEDHSTSIAYVPEKGAEINGKFFSGALPEWLVSAIEIAPGLSSQGVDVVSTSASIPDRPSSSGENEFMGDANALKMACLAYLFLKLYKKRLEASINCPLLISRNGENPFLPGGTLAVKNGSGTLLQGTVVSISHNLDMASGVGNTSMHLAYCRPAEGYDVLKEVMDKNPMYS